MGKKATLPMMKMQRKKPALGVVPHTTLSEMLGETEVDGHPVRLKVLQATPAPPNGVAPNAKTRCSGHCCRSFSIRKSPEELKAEFLLPKDDCRRGKDIDIMYSMLIYLGAFETNPLLRLRGESWAVKGLHLAKRDMENHPQFQMELKETPSYNSTGHYYACKNLSLDGNCTIYETRPHMCRSYPNGHRCQFADCTLSEEDQGIRKAEKLTLEPFAFEDDKAMVGSGT